MQKKDYNSLSIKELIYAEKLRDSLTEILSSIIQMKIDFWKNLLTGYRNIQDYKIFTIKLGNLLRKNIASLLKKYDINLMDNYLEYMQDMNAKKINMIILISTIVINDNEKVMEMQKYVRDLLVIDQNKDMNELSNLALIKEKIAVLSVSFVKDRGRLLNGSNKVAQYFGYVDINDLSQHVDNINDLMPDHYSAFHNLLIESYINQGGSQYIYTSFIAFFLEKGGFIKPAKAQLGNLFEGLDDYVMST